MKIICLDTKKIIFFTPLGKSGERHLCPECSQDRKKSGQKDFEWYPESNSGYCFHCERSFREYKPYESKQYKVPEWKNNTDLSDSAVKWFIGRGISQETLIKMKIYTDAVVMPQTGKKEGVVCFPYFRDNEIVNIKFRDRNKNFMQVSGAELILWNFDCLKDCKEVYITEGEIDALTYIQNGIDNVVSVPAGASNNTDYLDGCIEMFNTIDKIYLSTDADTKGIVLRDELMRRLGPEKCHVANFKECKDANEYYLKYGGIEFKKITYREPKVSGVVSIDSLYTDLTDYFNEGVQKGLELDNPEFDKFITWMPGMLAICTGVPGSGKSELIDYITIKLNLIHGWKTAYFSPENYPLKFHYSKIFEKLIGKKFQKGYASELEFDMAFEYAVDNFYYILDEDDLSLTKILQSAKFLVKQRGIKCLVIDPYNKIDHQMEKEWTETRYISWFLDQLKKFATLNNVLVILVAHPAKMQKGDIPTLYSISGSAHFYNKADYGFTMHRIPDERNIMTNEIQIHWQKIKFKHLGSQGVSEAKYNYVNGRFELKDSCVDDWDNSNWLVKESIDTDWIVPAENDKPF
jgi:twinkle protein